MHRDSKSFTLVELLIVIGILAILTAAVVVVLNPAELLRQARDSQRIQDLTAVEKALYLLETQDPDVFNGIANTVVYTSLLATQADCSDLGLPTLPSPYTYACATDEATMRDTDSDGWIPINFNTSFSGLATLPLDPVNSTSTGQYYTLVMGGSFELNALMESDKYRAQTASDGGDSFSIYERGNDKDLLPFNDDGLVGYWTFDEGTGTTAADSSGNGNTGTLTNGPTWQSDSNCKVRGCLSFDGSNDYVMVGAPEILNSTFNTTNSFSVIEWVNLIGSAGYYPQFNKGLYGPSPGFTIHGINGRLEGGDGSTHGFDLDNTFGANDMRGTGWKFTVVTYDGTAFRGYTNGLLASTNPWSYGIGSTDAYDLIIGSFWGSNFTGIIDDVRIYNRALSAAEIQAIYNSTR
ncbi:hypothetical protein A2755_01925 [Candidatus Wolfebacteria bacterium RIFCSPHIGHO2_01_FULL_48_22]|uniref:LamG-like jellyroll fold domain-containing protein n=2 Tax=Candidatus Wolfeibacteriota TaxID=1752735 RepID=A0A1F8DSI9_9BACT|nr:MAG: hypothetical protein A2755_01925 [Candidatus Wolfebacteria bacterium RIFCSPHIGHO2_01_FULL_48_22]OGM91990.1 MAG: hypothetical protein A2935_02565 [Candidatus Wolfebacteria bacterium RIFCSPLOWO2_01_FULL_47_17b]